jgi:hypothetical protein
MKKFAWLALMLIVLSGCGNDQDETNQDPRNNPGTPTPSGSKWSSQELQSSTSACAQAGAQQNSSYTMNQWSSFCGCVYNVAATRWTRAEFKNNFNSYYSQLNNDGTISSCLQQAGMSGGNAHAHALAR